MVWARDHLQVVDEVVEELRVAPQRLRPAVVAAAAAPAVEEAQLPPRGPREVVQVVQRSVEPIDERERLSRGRWVVVAA